MNSLEKKLKKVKDPDAVLSIQFTERRDKEFGHVLSTQIGLYSGSQWLGWISQEEREFLNTLGVN